MKGVTRLAHVCIQVKDIARTIAFYTQMLELPLVFRFTRNGAVMGCYFDLGGGTYLEAFENQRPCGITHFCLESDDIDAFIADMDRKGVPCTPKKLGCDHTWQTWLHDPDGNAFEIHQYTGQSLQQHGADVEVDW